MFLLDENRRKKNAGILFQNPKTVQQVTGKHNTETQSNSALIIASKVFLCLIAIAFCGREAKSRYWRYFWLKYCNLC